MWPFFISRMVLGLLHQLRIFLQLYLIELLGLLTGLGLLKLYLALNIYKALGRVWHAGHLHKLKSYGLLGQNLVLFILFSVIDSFKRF